MLTHKVRALSVAQIAEAWYPGGLLTAASRRLQALERMGLVCREVRYARVPPPLERPAFVWKRGSAPPEFGELSYRLVSRWQTPAVATPLVIATKAAAALFGGFGGQRPRNSESSHDLALAALFLRLREKDPRLASSWLSEANLRSRGFGRDVKLPDAAIQTGQSLKVIEFGGAYSAPKLEAFHCFCESEGLPYELW